MNIIKKSTICRIVIDLVVLFCVIHGWWFIALPISLFALWSYSYYIEIILAGIIYDILFGFIPEVGFLGYIGTVVSVLIFLVVVMAKKVVRR
ncbi:MAG: hypothetical protein WC666_02760 [Candidatus Paceibacterota bacterium]|jgi:hypothetical protein